MSAAAFRTRDLHMTTSRHVCVSGMNDLERFLNLIATLFIVTLLHQARAASAT